MAIVQAGDPLLRRPAARVGDDAIGSTGLAELISSMCHELAVAPGVGLAAPQIGVPLRVVVIQDPAEFHTMVPVERFAELERTVIPQYVLINPEIELLGRDTRTFFEGCLSVDGYRALVERHRSVLCRWTDPFGQRYAATYSGWHARILQHEIDHLDGRLYIDRMLSRTFMTIEHCGEWAYEPTDVVLAAFGVS